jgi:hypothetical protein
MMNEEQKDNTQGQNPMATSAASYDPVLFHNDEQLYFMYKKTEAISGAIFLITNLIADTEILKNKLRQESLSCLSLMVDIIASTKIDSAELQRVSSKINHLHSLIDITFWSGLISQMNSSLLQKEITAVYKALNNYIAKTKNEFILDQQFFTFPVEKLNQTEDLDQRQNKNKPVAQTTQNSKSHIGQDKGRSIKVSNVFDNVPKASVQNYPHMLTEPRPRIESNRREAILKLLSEKSNLGVKDFTQVIPDFSEKTIQRELVSLVQEGIIKKEGERRWSTYSMAV